MGKENGNCIKVDNHENLMKKSKKYSKVVYAWLVDCGHMLGKS